MSEIKPNFIGNIRASEGLMFPPRSHAYLVMGPDGMGKSHLATAFAQTVLCGKQMACGKCSNCKLFTSGSHPDFNQVSLPKIGIEEVRELTARLQLKPHSADYSVVIIKPAEAMTVEAQNALLKTLEEPASTALIILICQQPGALLPTIKSRCQIITLRPVASADITQALIKLGASEAEAKRIAILSLGQPGRALQLFESRETESIAEQIIQSANLLSQPLVDQFRQADELSRDDERFVKTVEDMLIYVRSLILRSFDIDDEITSGLVFESNLDKTRLDQLIETETRLLNLRQTLALNLNRRLALESLFYQMETTR